MTGDHTDLLINIEGHNYSLRSCLHDMNKVLLIQRMRNNKQIYDKTNQLCPLIIKVAAVV